MPVDTGAGSPDHAHTAFDSRMRLDLSGSARHALFIMGTWERIPFYCVGASLISSFQSNGADTPFFLTTRNNADSKKTRYFIALSGPAMKTSHFINYNSEFNYQQSLVNQGRIRRHE